MFSPQKDRDTTKENCKNKQTNQNKTTILGLWKLAKGIQHIEMHLFRKNLQKEQWASISLLSGLPPSSVSSSLVVMVDIQGHASCEKQLLCCWRGLTWFGVEH